MNWGEIAQTFHGLDFFLLYCIFWLSLENTERWNPFSTTLFLINKKYSWLTICRHFSSTRRRRCCMTYKSHSTHPHHYFFKHEISKLTFNFWCLVLNSPDFDSVTLLKNFPALIWPLIIWLWGLLLSISRDTLILLKKWHEIYSMIIVITH